MNPQSLHPEPSHTLPLPLGKGRGEGALHRPAFSLVELLVVVSIILVLMALVGGGVAAARGSQKKQATQALIAKLDAVIQQQFATYSSRSVPASALTGPSKSAARAAYLRRLASAEMPDSWEDVRSIASGTAGVALTGPQQSYQAIWNNLPANRRDATSPDYVGKQFADAECLFMIVMQGGIADCLDCGELKSSDKGDTDGDGAFEFLDDWGNCIRYVLWPAGLELPPDSGRFFSKTAPFTSGTTEFTKGGTMRPLLFSGGADQQNAIRVNKTGNLADGARCGDPEVRIVGDRPGESEGTGAADNITNFDAEAKK